MAAACSLTGKPSTDGQSSSALSFLTSRPRRFVSNRRFQLTMARPGKSTGWQQTRALEKPRSDLRESDLQQLHRAVQKLAALRRTTQRRNAAARREQSYSTEQDQAH